jgi:hypothetical protein
MEGRNEKERKMDGKGRRGGDGMGGEGMGWEEGGILGGKGWRIVKACAPLD